MESGRPRLHQLNIVSANPNASIEFYRRLGVEIPDDSVWKTETGVHHANSTAGEANGSSFEIELDSAAFASIWNGGWSERDDLSGRVVVGFQVASREAVDERFIVLTDAGYVGLQEPYDAFWGARYAIVEDPDGIAVGLIRYLRRRAHGRRAFSNHTVAPVGVSVRDSQFSAQGPIRCRSRLHRTLWVAS